MSPNLVELKSGSAVPDFASFFFFFLLLAFSAVSQGFSCRCRGLGILFALDMDYYDVYLVVLCLI